MNEQSSVDWYDWGWLDNKEVLTNIRKKKVVSLEISPDNRYLLIWQENGELRLYDIIKEKEMLIYESWNSYSYEMFVNESWNSYPHGMWMFSKDGKYIIIRHYTDNNCVKIIRKEFSQNMIVKQYSNS